MRQTNLKSIVFQEHDDESELQTSRQKHATLQRLHGH